jgi:Pretoxin HINT domain/A nuclease family of the HNH/ENDO VII superfamily with conserved AHH
MAVLRLALSLFLVLLHAAGTASPAQNAPVADNPCGRFGKLFSVAVGLYGAVGAGTDRNSFEGHTLVHTRVLTDTGYQTRLKPIADIQIGDEVLAWDELQAHDNAAVLKQASLEEKEAVFRRGYSIVSYENNSNADAKVASSASTKAVVSAPSAPSAQRYEKVTDTFSSVKEQTLLHITLSNGQTLQATQGHQFKTSEGWRDAILLKKGGKLLLKGGDADDAASNASPAERYTTITDIRTEVKTLPVFNLEVANLHTFFVGEDGVVVHNAIHHICTKYGDRGSRMDKTLKQAGFPKGVEDPRNLVDVAGHFGPHPVPYHDAVEKGLNVAAAKGTAAVEKFLKKMGDAATSAGSSVNDALTKKRGR